MVEKMKKNSGFTLVELIVAVALFAIVIGPLFQAFSSSIKANSRARGVLKATQLAQSVMDNVERSNVKELRDDMVFATLGANLLPPGISNASVTATRTTVNTDECIIKFVNVLYQDLSLNIEIDLKKDSSAVANPNTGNKYFMYVADVYVHMNKGAGASTPFSNEYLVHLRGSVPNIK
ncbi:MAG: type II secretion system protein [Lachnospiraceae bacterium]|nr:type II secretion system protein [Lachnospiraceae bacterium]